jgi:hypothetical protein
MGIRSRFVASALALFLLGTAGYGFAQQAAQSKAASPASAIDQQALDLLKKMSDTLSQAKTIRFQSRSMVPLRGPGGIWINLYGDSRVVMGGPDKLFAETRGDFAPYDFYFNGKTITAYAPDKNLYAEKAAPATIDELIEQAYKEDGTSFPYADLLVSEPYAVLTDGLTGALYVGQSTLRPLAGSGSVKTDHLVFSNKGVEWQIWIDVGDHLPRLVVATYLNEGNEPSYTAEFGDWKIDDPADASVFTFHNTTNAAKVEFRRPAHFNRGIAGSAARPSAGK